MYVLFILTGPVVIRALIEGKEKLVLLISGLLWFLSQWKIFQYNHFDLTQYGMHLGYFNIFCWQFLFFVGVFFGYSKATGKFRLPVTRRLVVISIIALLVFIAFRYSARDTFIYRVFSHFSDRSTLGIVRLINFGLIAYLIYVLTFKKENILKPGWLSFLGRHSLQVFAYSVCLIYFFMPFKSIIKPYGTWGEIIYDLVLVISLSIPAWLHQTAVKRIPAVRKLGM